MGANGSSDYTFTGPGLTGAENDVTLYLVRGQQYKFTNTMGMHPFRIQSTVNGSAGTQYNDGVANNDVSNGTLTWNVQFDAPNILYYQCTAHGGMGGKIYIIDAGIGPDISINTTGIITASSFSGNASSSTYATTAGIATLAQGLSGTPNISVGIVTATLYRGSGTNLTGIVTSIVAGTNISISGSDGQVTINSTASGGGGSQTLDQTLALGNSSALGMSVGVITATSYRGSGTNLTGIVTSIVAGTNITVSGSNGQVTINASSSGGGVSQEQSIAFAIALG